MGSISVLFALYYLTTRTLESCEFFLVKKIFTVNSVIKPPLGQKLLFDAIFIASKSIVVTSNGQNGCDIGCDSDFVASNSPNLSIVDATSRIQKSANDNDPNVLVSYFSLSKWTRCS